MQELSLFPKLQVEILNFQTFTTEYVAKRYGTSEGNIKVHKREHADEIIDGVHFVYELVDTNGGKQEVLKWTLRGIIKLGMFIRSKEAKYFRLWAEQELEKTILSELAQAKETRQKNLSLVSQVSSLNALLIDNAKRHRREINGYKSQLKQHNEKIVVLKHKLAKFEKAYEPEVLDTTDEIKRLKLELEIANTKNYYAFYKNALADAKFYRDKYYEAKDNRAKDERVIVSLSRIQKDTEDMFLKIGAVMAYIDNDKNEDLLIERIKNEPTTN